MSEHGMCVGTVAVVLVRRATVHQRGAEQRHEHPLHTANERRKPVGRGVGGKVSEHAAAPLPEPLPAAQLAQAVANAAAANAPGAQSAHSPAPAAAAKVPALQGLQCADDFAPSAAEEVPAGHTAQFVAPVPAW